MLDCKTELFPGIESHIFSGLSLLIQPLQGLLPILDMMMKAKWQRPLSHLNHKM